MGFNRKSNFIFVLLVLAIFFVSVSSVFSADVSVLGTDFSDIQSAIDSAGSGDTVKLGNVSYFGSGSQIRVNKSNIVIEGPSRSSGATLDAKGDSRIFWINVTNVTIRFVTFKNGDVNGTGSAIVFRGNTLVIDNCSFVSNTGGSGGAIAVGDDYDDVLINNSIFVDNHCSYLSDDNVGEGGAIDSHANNTRIFNCVFSGNSAITHGGALVLRGDNAFVENCSFSNNVADDSGGIYLFGVVSTDSYIANCNFTNNKASDSNGGAIRYAGGSFLKITNSKFVNNRAASNGGGIYLDNSNYNNIIDFCNFTSNSATNGGGLFVSGTVTTISIFNSNFISNGASSSTATASGIYSASKTIISSCDFRSNIGLVIRLVSDNCEVVGSNVSGSNVSGSSAYGIRVTGNSVLISNNLISKTYGVLVLGNNSQISFNKVYNTTVNNPISVSGNNTQVISNELIDSSLGISIVGDNLKFVSNNISKVTSDYALIVTGVNSEISGNDIISCNRGVSVSGNGLVFKDNFVSKIIGAYAVNIV
ncbi:MAG: right-handed parallel beta-helix repeat-containing protein, partial [Methanobacteriaceae archaeon]